MARVRINVRLDPSILRAITAETRARSRDAGQELSRESVMRALLVEATEQAKAARRAR